MFLSATANSSCAFKLYQYEVAIPLVVDHLKSGFILIQPSSSERTLKTSKNLLKIRQNFSVLDVSVVMTLSSLIVLNPSETDLLST